METASHPIVISGRVFKIARLQNEYYDFITDPSDFIRSMKDSKVKADLLTFVSEFHNRTTKYDFYHEYDHLAVLSLTTYDHWWKNQISDKTRNMARKAIKKGVEIKTVQFDDNFVRGIKEINDESPVRQGKPYWHYMENLETVKKENITFLEQTDFIGAYLGNELIGYLKLVIGNGKASIMQILSKMAHRDKAPNNALMAKAVEICTQKKIPHLHYAYWSRGGLGEFKLNHDFKSFEIPRYYVPLNQKGGFILKLKFHRKLKERLPEDWIDLYTRWRGKYYSMKYKSGKLANS